MKKNACKQVLAAVALAALFISPALAEDLMEVAHEGDIAYMTGGIGLEERDVMKASAKDFNLYVTNAVKDNHLTSDVMLFIKDKKGATLLTVKETGPLFYAKLPAGSYVVEAHNGDQYYKRRVKIGARSKANFHFLWGNGIAINGSPMVAAKEAVKTEPRKEVSEPAPAKEEKKESGETDKAKTKKGFFDFSPIMKDLTKDQDDTKAEEPKDTKKEEKNGKETKKEDKKLDKSKEPRKDEKESKKEEKTEKEPSADSSEDSSKEKRKPAQDKNHEETKGL